MNQTLQDTNDDSRTRLPGGRLKRIAFIQANWHSEIVGQAREAFLDEIRASGGDEFSVEIIDVPGAFEIPLQAKLRARSGHYAAIVAAGFVVDGGIYRHEFVADAVISGLMQVQLETEIPVISSVLTPQQFHEHDDHKRFFQDHFVIKGREAAQACTQTLSALDTIQPKAA